MHRGSRRTSHRCSPARLSRALRADAAKRTPLGEIFGELMRRMALIAAPVETAHIGDQGVRPLHLDLQRGNQGVLGFHHDPVALAFNIDTDGELRLHEARFPSVSSQALSLAKEALRANAQEARICCDPATCL